MFEQKTTTHAWQIREYLMDRSGDHCAGIDLIQSE